MTWVPILFGQNVEMVAILKSSIPKNGQFGHNNGKIWLKTPDLDFCLPLPLRAEYMCRDMHKSIQIALLLAD